jgi:predicted lipoprotein
MKEPCMSSTRLAVTLFAALGLAACSPQDPYLHTSQALSKGVVMPAYSAWAEADRRLAASALEFCANNQPLNDARQAFLTAQSAWAGLQPVLLGPLAEGNLAWQIQFWPDKKNLVARQVENLLKAKPQLTAAELSQASVVVQGLSAYEYLLFDEQLNLEDAEQKARYCPLLTAIGQHQQVLAAGILQQWQDKGGMASHFQRFPNDRYADAHEAIAELLRTQVSAIDGLKKKLGAPLGRQSKNVPQPYQAEAWRSKASLANLAAALASAERLWLGSQQDGMRSLLPSRHTSLAERIDTAYSETRQQLAEQQRPLGELLSDEQGRQQLNQLYDNLNRLHRLHEGELAKALGIQLGFNAHDGD